MTIFPKENNYCHNCMGFKIFNYNTVSKIRQPTDPEIGSTLQSTIPPTLLLTTA